MAFRWTATVNHHHLLLRHHRLSFPITAATSNNQNRGNSTITSNLHSPLLQSLTCTQKEQVNLYVSTLLQWNQRMNLTAVTEPSLVMERHVNDSLAIIPPIRNPNLPRCASACDHLNVIDVGSGAGLPGLVLAIACPDWKVTLLESMHKRCDFLQHAIGVMGLSNVQVVCDRAENVGQSIDFRETFDVVVARAVAEMRILVEYCIPLVRVGGLFVAAKGYDPQVNSYVQRKGKADEDTASIGLDDEENEDAFEEVRNSEKAIQLLGASIFELCSVESQGPYGQRTAVLCIKDRPTPSKYPRQPGLPAKKPL